MRMLPEFFDNPKGKAFAKDNLTVVNARPGDFVWIPPGFSTYYTTFEKSDGKKFVPQLHAVCELTPCVKMHVSDEVKKAFSNWHKDTFSQKNTQMWKDKAEFLVQVENL